MEDYQKWFYKMMMDASVKSIQLQRDPQSRASRLLAEAKERHPEWVVKKLQKPLDDSPGV